MIRVNQPGNMESETLRLLEQMCRTCLKDQAEKNIFEIHKPLSTDYASILKSCISVQINKNDGLPKNICTKCLKILLSFHKFKISTVENDFKLKKALEDKLRAESKEHAIYTIESIQQVNIIEGEIGQAVTDLVPLGQTFEVVSAVVIDNNPKLVPEQKPPEEDEITKILSADDLTFVTDSDSSESNRESSYSELEDTFKIKQGVKCEECGKILSSKRNLNQHLAVHSKKKPYSCNICDKRFGRAEHALIHKRIHTGERPHKCLICKKTFIQYATLRAHLGTHTNDKPFMCTECGKSFKQSASLSTHSRIHSGEVPFVCELCGKGFRTAGALNIHMRFHTNERPYICILCDKTFVTSSHLRVHHKSHTGEKPHKCIICHKAFARSEHLKSHLVIHSGRKPYQCKVCSRKYTQSSHLRRHVKTVHETKDETYIEKTVDSGTRTETLLTY